MINAFPDMMEDLTFAADGWSRQLFFSSPANAVIIS
jgi:hypothetical protein